MKERILWACGAGMLATLFTIAVIFFSIAILTLTFAFPKLFIGILALFIIWAIVFYILDLRD